MRFDPTKESEELFTDEVVAAESAENEATVETDGDEAPERASPAARKLEPIVLAHVAGPKYQPVKPRVIAKQLQLPSEQHKALKLAIRRLVKAGKLVYGSGHIVRRPKEPPTALTPALSQREREPIRALTAAGPSRGSAAASRAS